MPYDEYDTAADSRAVTVGTSDGELIGPGPTREAIIVSAPSTNRITVSFSGAAVLDQGITLYPGAGPLILLRRQLGRVIQQPMRAISAAASQIVGVESINRL